MKGIIAMAGTGPGATLLLAVVALLVALPTSGAVLCIAPGCHVALESPWEGCCDPGEHEIAGRRSPGGESGTAVGCPGCTDLYVLAEAPGLIQRPCEPATFAMSTAAASLIPPPAAPARAWRLPADTPGLLCPPSSVPLRR